VEQQNLKPQLAARKLSAIEPFFTRAFLRTINHGNLTKWLDLIDSLPIIANPTFKPGSLVSIGDARDCDESTRALLCRQLQTLMPWRKGPFSLFDIHIDSEWNSALKWDRLLPHISPLRDRSVLDVGCGNGYYGFRMLEAGAGLVLGIDPHIPYVMQYWALQRYTSDLPLHVAPVTLDQLPESLKAFDTVFSMGVLYHRKSPIEHLLQLKSVLKPGGELVIETLYVDGEKGYSLTPEKRYARMSNVWFIPSIDTLVSWLKKCGFSNINVASKCSTLAEEQRKTAWMPYQSLEDAVSTSDSALTIEGLPAPKRTIIIAKLAS